MSKFINTKDVIGDKVLCASIASGTVVECADEYVENIKNSCFRNCKNLTLIDFPNAKELQSNTFSQCSNLVSVNLPNIKKMYNYTFDECTNLRQVNIPLVERLGTHEFANCENLEKLELSSVTEIGAWCFFDCNKLSTLILSSNNFCSLLDDYYSAFMNTPINSKTGYIYVPGHLMDDYINGEHWEDYSTQFRPLTNYIWKNRSEVLTYNQSKTISIKYFSNNITPNILVTSDNENIIHINNISFNDEILTFNINSLALEGIANITINMTVNDEIFTRTFVVRVFENPSKSTYSVDNIDNVTYGFSINDNNYYESQNQGISDSFSLCKISFFSNGIDTLYLDCINNSQIYKDYGILSSIDKELGQSYSEDKGIKVFKEFSESSSTQVQNINYGIPEYGEHFIYVKYIKNSSTDSGNDSLQFQVRFVTGDNEI